MEILVPSIKKKKKKYCTGRSTPSCAHATANACVREHSTLSRRLSLPGLIVMTFQRLSSRRIQSLPEDPRRLLLVRPEIETSICRVLQIPSRARRQPTVPLCSINRDLQRYTGRQRCNSSKTKAKSFYRRPPKHSKTALFLFVSIVGL